MCVVRRIIRKRVRRVGENHHGNCEKRGCKTGTMTKGGNRVGVEAELLREW